MSSGYLRPLDIYRDLLLTESKGLESYFQLHFPFSILIQFLPS